MRVAIRADASLETGTGHVMRCLTLARWLRAKGGDVLFVCREEDGHLCDLIETSNFPCSRLPKLAGGIRAHGVAPGTEFPIQEFRHADARETGAAIEAHRGGADLLVVDHYDLDKVWETILRAKAGRVFVIDDLANREHDCDLLLDQNLHDAPGMRYSGLVPEGARVFVGPKYALLRPEFDAVPAAARDMGLRRMLAFFGGVDPTNEALKIVHALRAMGSAAPQTDLVLGPANPHADSILGAASGLPYVNVIRRTDDMAKLMREADLGVGTCGVAAWERCCAGLPSIVAISADNQRDDARILESIGAARNLGEAATIGVERWAREIRALRDDPVSLTAMSVAAASVMQGRGAAMRDLESALVP
jgi:UDP-2,4-diacetamido-2,4,6-trideoxy-beta-L-altropyranose hydrolase